MNTCIMNTYVMATIIMDTCIMDTCILHNGHMHHRQGCAPRPILYFIVYKRCSVGCVVVVGGRKVMYTIENHLFHPAKGAPQKRDDLHRKKGTLLVPFLRCPPSILMGNGGRTPPPPSLFTGAHFGFHLITEWSAGPFIHLLSLNRMDPQPHGHP